MGQFRRAALLLVRNQLNGSPRLDSRSMVTVSFQGIGNDLLFTNATNLSGASVAFNRIIEPVPDNKGNSGIDKRLALIRLRNSLTNSSRGLRTAKNRNDLVAEFYDLAKSVIDGQVALKDLLASRTFEQLQNEVNSHIDVMSNAQVVNITASLIKMKVNPSTYLIKLLEHEVKFRIRSLTISQIVKLLKFYNSTEMSFGQRQMTDILNNRLRSCIHNKNSTLMDMLEILQNINGQLVTNNYFAQIEERILVILTENSVQDDDMVSAFIPKRLTYDYESLCNLFIQLAANRRRPTPVLKAASTALSKLPFPKNIEDQPNVTKLVATLNALNSLSYPYRLLVSKLIVDLTNQIKLEDLDVTTQCNILRTLGTLRWRAQDLLKMFFNYVDTYHRDSKRVDHNLLMTLFYITAQLNYKPEIDLKQLYSLSMTQERESAIDKSSRKWLNHVWSVCILNIANESHFKSILNDTFIGGIEQSSYQEGISHSDRMKLLNLQAIAKLEHGFSDLKCSSLDKLATEPISRNSDLRKYASKIREALNGIVGSDSELCTDVHTPYGFVIDCEVHLDQQGQTLPIDKSLDKILNQIEPCEESTRTIQKCAIIYVLFDETIANSSNEVVGHKLVVRRILNNLGYHTVFLPQNQLSREKTSADLSNKIKELIKSGANEVNRAQVTYA